MNIVFVLIILAVILLSAAIYVFFWAVKQRQFDDLEVHAYSILKEDDYEKIPKANLSENLEEKPNEISALNPKKAIDQTLGNNK